MNKPACPLGSEDLGQKNKRSLLSVSSDGEEEKENLAELLLHSLLKFLVRGAH